MDTVYVLSSVLKNLQVEPEDTLTNAMVFGSLVLAKLAADGEHMSVTLDLNTPPLDWADYDTAYWRGKVNQAWIADKGSVMFMIRNMEVATEQANDEK